MLTLTMAIKCTIIELRLSDHSAKVASKVWIPSVSSSVVQDALVRQLASSLPYAGLNSFRLVVSVGGGGHGMASVALKDAVDAGCEVTGESSGDSLRSS